MTLDHRQYRISQDGYPPHQSNTAPEPSRWRVFLLVFMPILLFSQLYVFLQPAVYQSSATILTVAPTSIDQTSPNADLQHVSIQRRILLGQATLERTATRLGATANEAGTWTAERLKNYFSVESVPDTNLLQLRAEGPDAAWLRKSVNAWIDSYLQLRAEFINENTEQITAEINEQLRRIERQLADKRDEIERFRVRHDIVSTESSDNLAPARLQGLNKSLNAALEEEVKAKAKLDAIRDALAQGKDVVPEADSQALAVLLQQAEKLREQLAEYQARYTADYIELNPNLRRVKEQLDAIKLKIADKIRSGKTYAEQDAENNYSAARQASLSIRQQMEDHKKKASDYTTQFGNLQALQQELSRLETLQQETKQRLVDLDVKQRQQYPQVDVVEWASRDDKPIRPIYWQESLAAFALCLAAALLAVVIVDYLNRKPAAPAAVPMTLGGIHLHQRPQAMLDLQPTTTVNLGQQPLTALTEDTSSRELTLPEMSSLFNSAEPQTRGIIALLLNGLAVDEILNLTNAGFDMLQQRIVITAQRKLPMTRCLAELIERDKLLPDWTSVDEINALICCAAIDGKLDHPERVDAETLRYTYILFLVRQGIRLADLTKITGPLPSSLLLELSRYSPEQTGLALESINLDYFPAYHPGPISTSRR